MLNKRTPALILSATLLSACTLGPDHVRPAVETPAAFKEAGEWKPAEPRDPLAADTWWKAFGDPVLDALQDKVEISNQNLRIAEAQYRQARALADAARASWLPAVNATAGATRSATSAATDSAGSAPPRNSFSLGATASWELDVWGRIARNVEAADARIQASEADLAAATTVLIAELPQAQAAQITPVGAPLHEMSERLSGNYDAMKLADGIRALGADTKTASAMRSRSGLMTRVIGPAETPRSEGPTTSRIAQRMSAAPMPSGSDSVAKRAPAKSGLVRGSSRNGSGRSRERIIAQRFSRLNT